MGLCCPVFGQGRIDNDMASNKRRRHTPDQIIRKLAEGNKLLASGQELSEVCRHLQIAESTWHRWLAQYGAPTSVRFGNGPEFVARAVND